MGGVEIAKMNVVNISATPAMNPPRHLVYIPTIAFLAQMVGLELHEMRRHNGTVKTKLSRAPTK
jgi:hypothetical protein